MEIVNRWYMLLASQHKSRQWRLHNHYKTYPTKEQAIMNPPRGVKVPDWVLLCERFASEDFQKISTRNKLNRSKNEIPPANGTKSMARVIHMKTKQGEKVTAIGGFKICHFSTKKNEMINDKADEILHDLENEEANSSSTPAEICMEKLGYIPGHLKGRSASKRIILANESLQRELQLEKEKTKKLQIHINKIEKNHNNLKQKVDYLMKHLPYLSGWQSQGQRSEEYAGSDDDDGDGDDDDAVWMTEMTMMMEMMGRSMESMLDQMMEMMGRSMESMLDQMMMGTSKKLSD